MAGKIVLLSTDLTNRIAAGEVIERPASIVKELMENSLDAGATDITVELQGGGCHAIRITDNGEGMEPDDAALAFSRFATSKIYQFDDLYRVHSFGFRGEALPSIASIAHVEMVTKKKDFLAGVKVRVEAGDIREICEIGCPSGTSILVSDIFDRVPVRRKFLKSERSEQGHCLDVIARLALAHTAVRFTVKANGSEVLSMPSAINEGERLSLVLGTDFLDSMFPLSGEQTGIKVRGFASGPALTRSSARHIYCYANKRYIQDHLIKHAVMTAYRDLIPSKRYPLIVLLLELLPQDVDVNVHPAKLEVRFRRPRDVYEMILATVKNSLGRSSSGTGAGEETPFARASSASIPQYHVRIEQALRRYSLSPHKLAAEDNSRRELPHVPGEDGSLFPETEPTGQGTAGARLSDLKYIGQVGGTYLIFSSPERMIILDQHAAHERILFENLKKISHAAHKKPLSQRLLMPEVFSLPPRELALLSENLPYLEQCGFEIEPFGRDTVVIKAIPPLLGHLEAKKIITDLLEEYGESEGDSLEEKKERIYAFLACKGAVKANHPLSSAEVASLCRDLDNTPSALSCPHGRPIFIPLSFRDLEKMFKRR